MYGKCLSLANAKVQHLIPASTHTHTAPSFIYTLHHAYANIPSIREYVYTYRMESLRSTSNIMQTNLIYKIYIDSYNYKYQYSSGALSLIGVYWISTNCTGSLM